MFSADHAEPSALERTPLYDLHMEYGASMVSFSGYEMPVHYPAGIVAEHLHTREKAGLFDVSHMGQALLEGPDHETVAAWLETITPGHVIELGHGCQLYTALLNGQGGIIDDLMVTRLSPTDGPGRLLLVTNASRKKIDHDHMRASLPDNITLLPLENRALFALQGPMAVRILKRFCPLVESMAFMTAGYVLLDGIECHVSRSGYTGEDGFEISVDQDRAVRIARLLLEHENVSLIGLGARDTLRLEAGLCLYGQDLDETTSPVEANLSWMIGGRRRVDGGFAGAPRIRNELEKGPSRLRVGIVPEGKAPARAGTKILSKAGDVIGVVTSGGFAPTCGGPVAMGYVERQFSMPDTETDLMLRGVARPARIVCMPFVAHRYFKPRREV